MKVEPITPVFAARVTGIDLKAPLDDAAIRAIGAACDEHGMLVFPDQHLSTEELIAYGRRFGHQPATEADEPLPDPARQ